MLSTGIIIMKVMILLLFETLRYSSTAVHSAMGIHVSTLVDNTKEVHARNDP